MSAHSKMFQAVIYISFLPSIGSCGVLQMQHIHDVQRLTNTMVCGKLDMLARIIHFLISILGHSVVRLASPESVI